MWLTVPSLQSSFRRLHNEYQNHAHHHWDHVQMNSVVGWDAFGSTLLCYPCLAVDSCSYDDIDLILFLCHRIHHQTSNFYYSLYLRTNFCPIYVNVTKGEQVIWVDRKLWWQPISSLAGKQISSTGQLPKP